MRRLAAVIVLGALAAGCGGGAESGPQERRTAKQADPGPVHIHGLGVNPRDGALFLATHTGLFRAAAGKAKAVRVAGRYQDTMGFSVVGPDEFLGSGHPDGRENLPPFLGLIRSRDAGRTWQPVSLLGKVDFHVLEARGATVYGFGSELETREARFLASGDGGRNWRRLSPPEPLVSLAISPRSPRELVASGERGLHHSSDGGRRWRAIDGPAGLLAWTPDGVFVVDAAGRVAHAAAARRRWTEVAPVGGAPAAFEAAPDGSLYVALHDGTVKRSRDGGRTWTVRPVS